ncbi:hypothetical protein EDB86DRAFT_1566350 [Lactarius hatsudake]|nr:hypothetical protein EDB86DRAFT_1566350 [Lactarius hatsudake]
MSHPLRWSRHQPGAERQRGIRGNSTSSKLATIILVLDAHYPARCRSQPVKKDVRGREAEGKQSWGARVGVTQACLPTRRHRCQCVIVSWSADEAGQYLTAYRQSERRTLTLIYEHLTEAPDALLRTTLTGIESEQDGRRDTLCVIWQLHEDRTG